MAVASTSKAIKTGGDDLDDGLELDPELLAPSDGSDVEGEEVGVDEMRVDGVDEDDEVDDGDLQEDEEEPRRRAGVKRKVENLDEDAKAEEKKRRKKEKEKERKARVCSKEPIGLATTQADSIVREWQKTLRTCQSQPQQRTCQQRNYPKCCWRR